MTKNYWNGNGENAWIAKSVVSGSGHVVAKNYSRDSLRDGDVGLEMRVDRGKLGALTPEQRLAAQNAGKEMCDGFLQALGVEHESEGFKPGMLVSATPVAMHAPVYGLIQRVTENAIVLKTFKPKASKPHLVHIPLGSYVVEEETLEYEGLVGLVALIGTDYDNFRKSFASLSQEDLIRIAQNETDNNVVLAALEHITHDPSHEPWLIKIALTNKGDHAREEAIERITDQAALLKIALKHARSADIAVANITDQHTLAEVVKAVKHDDTRDEALERITDQDVLIDLAKTLKQGNYANDALKRVEHDLSHEPWLAEFVLRHPHDHHEALSRIEDQDRLIAIAKETTFWEVAYDAVKRIEDQAVLFEIALTHPDDDVRVQATTRITDRERLLELTKSNVSRVAMNARHMLNPNE